MATPRPQFPNPFFNTIASLRDGQASLAPAIGEITTEQRNLVAEIHALALGQGETPKALVEVASAIKAQPDVAGAVGLLAESLATELREHTRGQAEVAKAIAEVTNAVQARPDLAVALHTLANSLETGLHEIAASQGATNQALADIATALRQPTQPDEPDEPTELPRPGQLDPLATCLRALNQVEDVVVDSEFEIESNNQQLTDRLTTDLTNGARHAMSSDRALVERFDGLFGPFKQRPKLETQRTDRMLAIEQMRIDLFHHFAKGAPDAPPEPGSA